MTNLEIKKHLFSAQPLQYLDMHELDRLIAYSRILTFTSERPLLRQGKISAGMFILTEGNANVTAKVLGKGLIHFATLKPGDFTGEVSLIEHEPSTLTVVPQDVVQCLMITSTYFDMLSTFFPEMRYKITQGIINVVCGRLQDIYKKIIALMQESNISDTFIFEQILKKFIPAKETTFEAENIDMLRLKRTPLFDGLRPEEYQELLSHMQLLKAPKNCSLIQHGEKNGSCYMILRGAVQSNITQNNKIAKIGVLGPLCVFGGTSFLDNCETIFSYVTCEKCIILKIDAENLSQIQEHNILLWYKLYDLLAKAAVAAERTTDKLFIRLNSEIYNR